MASSYTLMLFLCLSIFLIASTEMMAVEGRICERRSKTWTGGFPVSGIPSALPTVTHAKQREKMSAMGAYGITYFVGSIIGLLFVQGFEPEKGTLFKEQKGGVSKIDPKP
uniref:F18O14.36 n=1 Tax=Arabidopsis thaliana TaxID=3702 RepID=Q9LN34_ARATH|nr:F18O14.36 [Arabidopsis thaliana]